MRVTGARGDRTGKLSAVGRGTLLLDDVDALPVEHQAKLLRVVDERVFEPVGSNKPLPLRARLIAGGAEAIIAGCTEVPLVLAAANISAPLINSTDCLVEATIAAARGDIE